MKKVIIFGIVHFVFFISAQVYKFDYDFTVKEFNTKRPITNTSYVLTKYNDPMKLYIMNFNTQQNQTADLGTGNLITSQKPYQYICFTKDNKDFIIQDFVQDNYYIFNDKPNFNWTFGNESKNKDGITLYKAFTEFRGRRYIAWYKKDDNLHAAPWKFSGIDGIIYEIYDEDNNFKWKLTKSEKTNEKIINPIEDPKTIFSYQKYPKIRYALPPKLEAALSKNPNRTIFEQPRVDLEIKFDDEIK